MIINIHGDLTKINTQYISHQCNCTSKKVAGLAKNIFEKFPWSDIYSRRSPLAKENLRSDLPGPGSISIHGDGENQRYVINMLAQIYPGKPKYPEDINDGYSSREKYFISCLNQIAKIENLESIAFPKFIGCGLAGGSWERYREFIENFATIKKELDVYIVDFSQ
jgi:O-acetyl-ADP-ribose deacetylase (regulator of RNase III)